MRIRYGVAAAAVVAAMAGGQALAEQPTSAYVGIGGSAVWVPGEKYSPTNTHLDFDTGWAAGGTLGLRWKSGFRAELEGTHRESDFEITSQGAPGVVIGGKVKSSSIMVNILRDFDIGWYVSPYIGVGIGAAKVKFEALGVTGDATGGIYQFIGGLSAPLTKRLEAFADYRYFETFQADAIGVGDNFAGHQVTAGLRWTFWQAEKPMPVAAPAPAPMAAPKDYVIYFEFDKAKITSAAGAVLDELKSTSGGQSVSVTGHTDTVGSAGYNQKLSDRRAGATAKALETRGVKVDAVTGKGFSEPAVQTGPGVKEPLNRRSVIKLDGPAAPSQ